MALQGVDQHAPAHKSPCVAIPVAAYYGEFRRGRKPPWPAMRPPTAHRTRDRLTKMADRAPRPGRPFEIRLAMASGGRPVPGKLGPHEALRLGEDEPTRGA